MADSRGRDAEGRRQRFGDVDDYETVIGAGTTITGEVHGVGNVDLRGTLEGRLEIEGLLHVRAGARVVGDVTATNVIVEGEVRGEIRAVGKVELRTTCRVVGDLVAESVAIGEGGLFDGTITMSGRAEPRHQVSFVEKRSTSG